MTDLAKNTPNKAWIGRDKPASHAITPGPVIREIPATHDQSPSDWHAALTLLAVGIPVQANRPFRPDMLGIALPPRLNQLTVGRHVLAVHQVKPGRQMMANQSFDPQSLALPDVADLAR